MATHGRRNEPQFFNIYELDWQRSVGPQFTHGIEAKVCTRDEETDATTFMVRIPPGWRHSQSTDEGTLEIFVLEGDLSVEGKTVGCTGFVAIPKGSGPVEMSSESGCQAFAFWEPGLRVEECYDGGQLQVRKIWEEPWIPSVMPELQAGIMHKSLRVPDPHGGIVHGGPTGMLRLILMAPGFGETRQEVHHDCWEEIIWLTGDFLMPQRGLHAPGSLLANPPDLKHGPLLTMRGNIQILHCNAPMGADFHFFDGGTEIQERFQDGSSWLKDPVHVPWAELPDLHIGAAVPGGELKYDTGTP
jgi:hypothetical protein